MVNTILVQLNLADNDRTGNGPGNYGIGNRGIARLANSLRMNKTLTRLDISGNCTSEAGFELVLEALDRNETLKHLDLGQSSPEHAERCLAKLTLNRSDPCLVVQVSYQPTHDFANEDAKDDATKICATTMSGNTLLTSRPSEFKDLFGLRHNLSELTKVCPGRIKLVRPDGSLIQRHDLNKGLLDILAC